MRFKLGPMDRRRLCFEKMDLQDSTNPTGEAFEEMIHNREGVGEEVWILRSCFVRVGGKLS